MPCRFVGMTEAQFRIIIEKQVGKKAAATLPFCSLLKIDTVKWGTFL